ncbi:MAG: molybdopterin-dependent oxidoreductase [Candidatus Kapabacteria bacterium]|nr:molybdopterin-dependent oxidoreductase [Candidatus Kapabacteria bacterium]
MPHIVIDGTRIETSPDKTIIQAATENGINISHFCWHPELSVSGNCRMCLVEIGLPKRLADGSFDKDSDGKPVIGFFPKLQIACSTQVSEGMHINTKTDKVIKAQESVMEFLLINHPLDCPICDEAGQCKLQEYEYRHSNGQSRFEEEKNHKEKRVKWSNEIFYDGERCISCSRCIRFAREVAKQDVLAFVNRGDKVTIKVSEGKEFNNDYSMNVIDICPVGALTSGDFRFSSRVWDMSFNDSICPGCARGCNIKIGSRANKVLRVEPRNNMFVNKYWMCDYGRLSWYENINECRINEPQIRVNGSYEDCSWDQAVDAAYQGLKKYQPNEIMFIGSAYSSNEDNFLLKKFAKKIIKTNNIDFQKYSKDGFEDNKLKVNDTTPNTNGLTEIGVAPDQNGYKINDIAKKIAVGQLKAVYILDDSLGQFPELLESFAKAEFIIVHASNKSKLTEIANVVFATSTFAECEGTFVNFEKRVQHFKPALISNENISTMGAKMDRLEKFGSHNDRWSLRNIHNSRQSWRIIMQLANKFGAAWTYKSSSNVFDEITDQIQSLSGMSYKLLDEYQGLVLGKAGSPDKKVIAYQSYTMKPN